MRTAPWYGETPFPPLGLQAPLVAGYSLADVLHPVASKTLKMLNDYGAGQPVGTRNPFPDVDTMRSMNSG